AGYLLDLGVIDRRVARSPIGPQVDAAALRIRIEEVVAVRKLLDLVQVGRRLDRGQPSHQRAVETVLLVRPPVGDPDAAAQVRVPGQVPVPEARWIERLVPGADPPDRNAPSIEERRVVTAGAQ